MPYNKQKDNKYGKSRVELLRNLRIVAMRKLGLTYDSIAEQLYKENPKEEKLSRQRIHSIYKSYKDVPFRYEDDQVIIH